MKVRTLLFIISLLLILLWPLAGMIQVQGVSPEVAAIIRLQYASFNPLAGEPDIPSGQRLSIQANRPATYILQFTGPVQEKWKAAVERAGVRLYGYIPDYAFLARMTPEVAQELRSLPFVRWVGPYHPAYRLARELQVASGRRQGARGEGRGARDKGQEARGKRQGTIESSEVITVTVQTLPDVDLDALSREIESAGGKILGQAANAIAGYFRVLIAADRLDDLAALDGVVWVEPYFEFKLCNDVGGGQIMRADEIRGSLGLYGSGQIVAVADSGLDTGNLNTLHPDVRGRVIKTYCLGRPNPCDWSDYVAHGTHVVGSVLGNGSVSGSNPSAHQYANTYAGVAPEAQLVFQSTADAQGRLGGIPMDVGDLMRQAYQDGARIHSNSWGGPTGGTPPNLEYGGYHTDSQQVDQVMWKHKDMLVLFAAGNDGTDADRNGVVDPDSVEKPGTAKNVLTVGASENDRSSIPATWGDYEYGSPISTDKKADNPDGMAAFSSRGPTDDGRIKPDIVAPGTYVASMRTHQYAFNDDMEGDTGGYFSAKNNNGQGTGDSWQLLTDDPHSPTHYWKHTVNGAFGAGAMTILLTPPINVYPTGGFNIHFWHKYSLGGDNQAMLVLTDSDLTPMFFLPLNLSGTQSDYTLFTLPGFPAVLCDNNTGQCTDPTAFRIGFTIYSQSGNYNSQWWLDDIRVDGLSWGTMSSVGLAQPGDDIDENYLMMGGTSMATPLTAGAAALVREWLTRIKGVSNPSAALMKAILINGAADMAPGQYGTGDTQEIPDQRPNNVTGWGRVDLVESLDPPSPRQIWFKDNTTGLSTGGTAVYTLTVGQTGNLSYPPFSAIETLPVSRGPVSLPLLSPDGSKSTAHQIRPLATTNLLQNGSFENATGTDLDYWEDNDPYGYYIGQTDADAYDGTYSAFMGGYYGADLGLWQGVSFPSDATDAVLQVYVEGVNLSSDVLKAELWIETGDPDTLVDTRTLNAVNGSWTENTWQLSSDTINQLKGQTVYVLFRATMASSSSFYLLDLASLSVTSGIAPALTITPESGPRGTTFTVTGSNFNSNDTITIAIDGVDQFNVSSDGSGSFSFNLTPSGTESKGIHTVTATDTGGHSASDTYEIVPQVSVNVSPSSGNPGDSFTVTGSGFHGGSTIIIKLDGTTDGTTTANNDGDFTYTLNTDPSIAEGTHTVSATDDEGSTDDATFTISSTPQRSISISPASGPNGTTFTITGSNFTPNADVILKVDGTPVKTVKADNDGSFSTTYTPTNLSIGQHTLVADDGDGYAQTTFNIVGETGGTFRITLAWTDYPGEPTAAKALVNDLDLEVIAPDGTHYYGNQGLYTSGQCLRDNKWDACNNVEGVIIPNAPYGTYTVIVHGVNVPQGPQPFALVASGDYLREGSAPLPEQHKVYLPLLLRQ